LNEPVVRLQRRSSGEQVADHLRREIFAGRLAPGDKILQEDVAARLGVSRIPVREALVILENEGRVRMELHRGAFVLPMDAESVRDNSEIYGMIYGFVARRAAERKTPELEQRLQRIAESLVGAERPEDIWGLAEAYLDTILEFGAAPRLARVLRRMRTLAVDNLFDVVPGTLEVTRTGTIALIEAICEGDGDAAEAEQRDMQRRSAEFVVEAFAARGLLGVDDPA
jgi:DNA-binding GntR family transcriptional regulator